MRARIGSTAMVGHCLTGYVPTLTSDGDRLPKTQVLGFGSAMEKWVYGKLNKAFFISPQILGIFDDFSKWSILNSF